MCANQRYIENEDISRQMEKFVLSHGGTSFFKKSGWKRDIKAFFKDCIKNNLLKGTIQEVNERFLEIKQDMLDSKQLIEERLNKTVHSLAYPWFKGSRMAVEASREAGYKGNFWGTVANSAINRVHDDSFYLKRISADFIFTLPGKGRKSILQVIADKHFKDRFEHNNIWRKG
jgi:hypothetical protein